MVKDMLIITDNRTGKQFEIPILYGTYPKYGAAIRALDLRQIRVADDDFGLMCYDPSYTNTASCNSSITFIDGERGILRYRGYPVEVLAETCTYLEVAYLLLHGELPAQSQLEAWTGDIIHCMTTSEFPVALVEGFRQDAHPMVMLCSAVAALSTLYPDGQDVGSADSRHKQVYRLLASVPVLAAFAYRHTVGYPCIPPHPDLTYTGNFLNMMFGSKDRAYTPHPVLEKALDVLFILHADHEQNCSTSVMRAIASSHADPYVSMAGAIAALWGPLHGGANEQALHMLASIGTKDKVPDYVKRVKAKEVLLMGFGHRVYRNYDPRARVLRKLINEVFEITGRSPLLDVALELERIALQDEYFITRRLYPNVDFYSGLLYEAMGFPVRMFPVLFAIPRTSGWLAQWIEALQDPEQKIARPRQIYQGPDLRNNTLQPPGS